MALHTRSHRQTIQIMARPLAPLIAFLLACGDSTTGPGGQPDPSQNAPPTVTVTSPAAGAEFEEGDPVTLTATASDAEDGDLSSSIAWTSSLTGALGTGATVVADLSVGTHLVQATVTDSDGATASASRSVSVVPSAPEVLSLEILEPGQGAHVAEGQPVTLVGKAISTDLQDISSSIEWASDIDGLLGSGDSIAPVLSLGSHLVTATVHGATAVLADSVAVTVDAPISLVDQPITLTSGGRHSCALDSAGRPFCWGQETTAFFGRVPTPLAGGRAFERMSEGSESTTCALDASGAAFCWPANGSAEPVAVEGGLAFSDIAVGRESTCALDENGAAYCWGHNLWGQLGTGDFDDRTTPTPVRGNHRFARVAVGTTHTCALDEAGQAWCWGNGGRRGDGSTAADTSATSPVPVSGSHTFVALAAGPQHTCGLTPVGQAYCWGSDGFGRSGNGDALSLDLLVPTQVVGGHQFATISAGAAHTCAVTTTHEAYCWGLNTSGELGTPQQGVNSSSTPLPVFGGHAFEYVSAGGFGSCGRTTDEEIYCWGSNFFYEMGLGENSGGNDDRFEPVLTLSPDAVSTVAMSPDTLAVVTLGRTLHLSAVALNGWWEPMPARPIAWSSAASDIVSVASSGLVTADSMGITEVRAESDGRSGTVLVAVARDVEGTYVGTVSQSRTAGTRRWQLDATVTVDLFQDDSFVGDTASVALRGTYELNGTLRVTDTAMDTTLVLAGTLALDGRVATDTPSIVDLQASGNVCTEYSAPVHGGYYPTSAFPLVLGMPIDLPGEFAAATDCTTTLTFTPTHFLSPS